MDLQEAQAARMVIEWKKQGMRQKDMAHPHPLRSVTPAFGVVSGRTLWRSRCGSRLRSKLRQQEWETHKEEMASAMKKKKMQEKEGETHKEEKAYWHMMLVQQQMMEKEESARFDLANVEARYLLFSLKDKAFLMTGAGNFFSVTHADALAWATTNTMDTGFAAGDSGSTGNPTLYHTAGFTMDTGFAVGASGSTGFTMDTGFASDASGSTGIPTPYSVSTAGFTKDTGVAAGASEHRTT